MAVLAMLRMHINTTFFLANAMNPGQNNAAVVAGCLKCVIMTGNHTGIVSPVTLNFIRRNKYAYI